MKNSITPRLLVILLVILGTVLSSERAGAAVSALGTPTFVTAADSIGSYSVPAGTNRLLLVTVSHADTTEAAAASAVTFNGQAMTQVAIKKDGAAVDSIWARVLGDSGSATSGAIVVTRLPSTFSKVISFLSAQAFQNVDQTTPTSGATTGNNPNMANSASTLSVPSAAGDLVMDLWDVWKSTALTLSANGGQTVLNNSGSFAFNTTTVAGYGGFAGYATSTKPGAAGSVSTGWTSNAEAYIHVALNIKGVAVASAPEIVVTETGVGDVPDNGTFSFGTTTVGTSVTKIFTVTNNGDANLTLSNLTVPSGFTVTSNFAASVPGSGGATTFQITMNAGAAAVPSGTLSFDNNDATENPYNFTISGTVSAPPTITSLNRLNTNPANFLTVGWRLVFSSAVTGVSASNFSLTGAAAAGLSVNTPTTFNGGLWWDVSVTTGSTDGTLTLNLANATGLTPGTSTSLPYVGQSYTIDKSPPSVAMSSAVGNPAPNAVIPVTVTFSESVTGFALTDITVANATKGNFQTISGSQYSFDLTPSGPGVTVTADIAAFVANDAAINNNTAATQFSRTIAAPEIAVGGNGNPINDGSLLAAASTTNATDFGSTPVQGGIVEITYTIANTGDAALNLTGGPNFVSVSPSTDFSVTQQPTSPVAVTIGTTTFKIAFNPTTAATTSATVSFGNNDADEGAFDFVIKGTGTPAQTFDAAGNALANSPFDTGETYIYTTVPVNVAPVITSNGGGPTAAINVAENSTAVTTVTANDADIPAQTLTYSVTGGADQLKFSIVPATGVLTFQAAPDFENRTDAGGDNVYDVTVTVTDNGTGLLTDVQAISVTVTDANEAPIITSNLGGPTATVSIAENTTAVTTVTANDVDVPAQTLSYSITGGADQAKFSIVPATGVLTFQAAPNFESAGDADFNNVYEVTVTVTDNGSGFLTDFQAISVTVTDANEAPIITSNLGGPTATVSIAENTTAVTTVTANDVDAPAQMLSYSITGGADQLKFSIVPATGVLTFQAAPDFENRADAGSNNVYEVTVTVTDNGTGLLTDSQDISVTVTDVNETPIIARTNATVTVDEGSLAGNTGTFSDPEGNATATLSASVGTVTPNNGAGTWSWAFTPADGPTDNQTVIITANDGLNPAVTTSFSLVVNNVAPVYDLGSPVTLASNVDTLSTNISFVDPGTDSWSGTVDYGDGSGTGPLSVNGGAKTFALSHVYAVSGTYTVSVTLSDDDAGSLSDSVNVTVSLLPTVTTLAADPVKALKATLQGTVNARGLTATPTFELGTTSGVYTQTIATVPVTVSGSSVTSVSALVTGLAQQTTYFYRLTGSSSAGAVQGGELSFTTPEAVPTLRPLALAGNTSSSVGSQVPGSPVNTSYHTFFGSPAVGSAATFAVRGQIKRPDGRIQHALFLGTGPQLFLRGQDDGSGPGDPVPASLPGGTYLNFFDPVLNASNQIAFMANTGGAAYASGQRTIFTNIPDGIMKVIARQGATMSGFTFGTPSNVSAAGEGVIFTDGTKLYGWENDQGLQLLFNNGQTVSVNGTPRTVSAYEFVLNTGYGSAQGRAHVVDSVTGNQRVALAVSFTDGSKGIVKGSIAPNGTLSGFDTAVLVSGEPIDKLNTGAPVIAGATWGASVFQKAGWDQSGKYFGFQGFIQGGTYGSTVVNTYSNSALFVDVAPGETILQVREGEQAAGTPAGVTYRDFFELSMGDSPAQYAFYADLRGPGTSTTNNIGLWYKTATGIKLAMRTGSSPHGVGGATVKNITLFGQPAQAGLGVVADLNQDLPVNATNDRGFWAVNSLGEVKLGLREGQSVSTIGGPRTVGSFVILNAGLAANGASRGFSRDGFFTALITFTDGSQIIVEIEVP